MLILVKKLATLILKKRRIFIVVTTRDMLEAMTMYKTQCEKNRDKNWHLNKFEEEKQKNTEKNTKNIDIQLCLKNRGKTQQSTWKNTMKNR